MFEGLAWIGWLGWLAGLAWKCMEPIIGRCVAIILVEQHRRSPTEFVADCSQQQTRLDQGVQMVMLFAFSSVLLQSCCFSLAKTAATATARTATICLCVVQQPLDGRQQQVLLDNLAASKVELAFCFGWVLLGHWRTLIVWGFRYQKALFITQSYKKHKKCKRNE